MAHGKIVSERGNSNKTSPQKTSNNGDIEIVEITRPVVVLNTGKANKSNTGSERSKRSSMAKSNKRSASEVSNRRSSGRQRKSTDLFNIGEEPKKRSKRSALKKRESVKKSINSEKKRRSSSKNGKNDNEDYEINEIIDHRIYDGYYVEYCVTWKGYPKEKTWLTEYDLRSAKDLLADYKYSVTNRRDHEGEEYAVEEILTHRDVGKKRYYLVHWKGWDNVVSHTELEESELAMCSDLLNKYKKSIKEEKNPRKRGAPKKNSKAKKSAPKKKKARSETPEEESGDEDNETSEVQEDNKEPDNE